MSDPLLRRTSRRSASLLVQIVLLLFFALAGAQLINALVVLSFPPPDVVLLARLDEAAAALTAPSIGSTTTNFKVDSADRPPTDNYEDPTEAALRNLLARHLKVEPSNVQVIVRIGRLPASMDHGDSIALEPKGFPMHRPMESLSFALRQNDGIWRVATERQGLFEPWQQRILIGFAGSILFVAVVGSLFARRLTAPIRTFVDAAERLGRDPHAPSLAAEGPAEIGVAARAFNDMQERLRRYIDDRTAMIGAIAHDLRTPLTRLAFRVERAPGEFRLKAEADIAEMETMIAATLAFVRDTSRLAVRERLDLCSLVESVAIDSSDAGFDIAFKSGGPLIISADPSGMRRVFSNLMINACRYGVRARVSIMQEGSWAVVEIDDDGPGLPRAEFARVFEPFYRLERSRNRNTGGVGLGLAIVRAVVLAHGGNVTLENRHEGGARAIVSLPTSS